MYPNPFRIEPFIADNTHSPKAGLQATCYGLKLSTHIYLLVLQK